MDFVFSAVVIWCSLFIIIHLYLGYFLNLFFSLLFLCWLENGPVDKLFLINVLHLWLRFFFFRCIEFVFSRFFFSRLLCLHLIEKQAIEKCSLTEEFVKMHCIYFVQWHKHFRCHKTEGGVRVGYRGHRIPSESTYSCGRSIKWIKTWHYCL